MKKIGFIDYYLDEWHADNYPAMIEKMGNGDFKVCYAYGMIDNPSGSVTNKAWAEKMGIELCETINDVVEKSDCLIVLSPDNSEMHEKLCEIPLKSGKNTYIDKTFAPTKEIAERIFSYAEKYGTRCYSSSAVPFAEEFNEFCEKRISHISYFGGGKFEIYAVHQVEPIISLMGNEVKSIMFVGGNAVETYKLLFADGRTADLNFYKGNSKFSMYAATDDNMSEVVTIESHFFDNAIKSMLSFFETGKSPVSHERTIAVMNTIESGIKAKENPFEWIELK